MTNEERYDGGHAFPGTWQQIGYRPVYQSGMSLRDWFAGMALQGMLAGLFSDRSQQEPFIDACARDAYKMADAMIAERMRK